ncbi:MAG TPA: cupin domain-containing protein [Pedomonas sp.]|uniref:cupin domain-containing protein n=1 Tax=Pedomonas sp. TaxID=2976421 RepID=UPI002F414FFB
MRRIVTGTTNGRSHLLSVEAVPETAWSTLWSTQPDAPLGLDNGLQPGGFPAGPGHTNWAIVSLPPVEQMRAALAAGAPGADPEGFHLTNTIDYVVVLDGAVTLKLDDEEVVVQPGDLVVQRNTNHAWHNHNEHPVRLLAFMVGVPA